MKKFFIILVTIFLFSSTAGKADAFYIVDTGTPNPLEPSDYSHLYDFQVNVFSEQWFAGKFSLDQGYKITDIEGYLRQGYTSYDLVTLYDTLTIAVYGGSNIPVVGNDIFNQKTSIEVVPYGFQKGEYNWYGLNNLNLYLPSGDYWAAFEVRSDEGDDYSGGLRNTPPNPLERYARYTGFETNTYSEETHPDFRFALRIQGDNNTVPEPATMVLLGSGLIGGAFIRRKRS